MLLEIGAQHPQVMVLAEHVSKAVGLPRGSACAWDLLAAKHVERIVEALHALAPVVQSLRVVCLLVPDVGVALASFTVYAPQPRGERLEVVIDKVPLGQLTAHRRDVLEHLLAICRLTRVCALTLQPLPQSFDSLKRQRFRMASGEPVERLEPDLRVARPREAPTGVAQGVVYALELLLAELAAQQTRKRTHALDRLARLMHQLGGVWIAWSVGAHTVGPIHPE